MQTRNFRKRSSYFIFHPQTQKLELTRTAASSIHSNGKTTLYSMTCSSKENEEPLRHVFKIMYSQPTG